jgi:lipoate---protein ligase
MFNLALEEVLLKNRTGNFLIVGVNEKSVIIGKHQVLNREVNARFIAENNIPVIRRISGGGAVYHDEGNLNFSFIVQSDWGRQVDFHKYTLPIISFLSANGVDARFEGKNNLTVDGLKVSGNAEHVHHNRVLHHGTLLFDSSLEAMRNSLRSDTQNYNSYAVESNPSPVMNLKGKLRNVKEMSHLRSILMTWLVNTMPDAEIYKLGLPETEEAESLAESKYKTWEWNYAYGPEYHFNKKLEIASVECQCNMYIKDGIIRECKIEGSDQMVQLSDKMTGIRHMPADLLNVFKKNGVSITEDEIFGFL